MIEMSQNISQVLIGMQHLANGYLVADSPLLSSDPAANALRIFRDVAFDPIGFKQSPEETARLLATADQASLSLWKTRLAQYPGRAAVMGQDTAKILRDIPCYTSICIPDDLAADWAPKAIELGAALSYLLTNWSPLSGIEAGLSIRSHKRQAALSKDITTSFDQAVQRLDFGAAFQLLDEIIVHNNESAMSKLVAIADLLLVEESVLDLTSRAKMHRNFGWENRAGSFLLMTELGLRALYHLARQSHPEALRIAQEIADGKKVMFTFQSFNVDSVREPIVLPLNLATNRARDLSYHPRHPLGYNVWPHRHVGLEEVKHPSGEIDPKRRKTIQKKIGNRGAVYSDSRLVTRRVIAKVLKVGDYGEEGHRLLRHILEKTDYWLMDVAEFEITPFTDQRDRAWKVFNPSCIRPPYFHSHDIVQAIARYRDGTLLLDLLEANRFNKREEFYEVIGDFERYRVGVFIELLSSVYPVTLRFTAEDEHRVQDWLTGGHPIGQKFFLDQFLRQQEHAQMRRKAAQIVRHSKSEVLDQFISERPSLLSILTDVLKT